MFSRKVLEQLDDVIRLLEAESFEKQALSADVKKLREQRLAAKFLMNKQQSLLRTSKIHLIISTELQTRADACFLRELKAFC